MLDIDQTPFVVVDTETTGHVAKTERIIEIGAVKMIGGEVVGEFSQLIHPGKLIPSRISRLTRITNGMVLGMPEIQEVLPEFLDFIEDSVLVAHNLSFDIAFLNAELQRVGMLPIDNVTLCTLRLARRLLRGLRSKGLTALSAFYGIKVNGRHRALGDARATSEVLMRFLEQLSSEKNITTCEDLIRFQFTSYAPKKGTKKRLVQLRDSVVPTIPALPGVYAFKGRKKNIIYVGKAKNLQARVRTYFTSIEAHSNHIRKLIEQVHDVEWTCMDSELEALIEESKRIKAIKPRFNRAQRHYRNRPFIKLTVKDAFPRVLLTSYLVNDGAEYFGPVASKQEGNAIIRAINHYFLLRECGDGTFEKNKKCLYHDLRRCEAPCNGEMDPLVYEEEVSKVKDFLLGRSVHDLLDRLQADMAHAAVEMDYEKAATLRDMGEVVARLMERHRCIAAPVLEHNAVVIDRSADDGRCRLLVIRFGRLEETIILNSPEIEKERQLVEERIEQHFHEPHPQPSRYLKAEIEEIRLLAHWLYVYRDEAVRVDYMPGEAAGVFAERLLEHIRS